MIKHKYSAIGGKGEIPMENHHGQGLVSTIISIFFSALCWISLQNAQTLFAILASLVAAVSGIFAIRYYWYAAKEKKMNIKQLKSK